MPINNAHLRAFHVVAREGSFTGAAVANNVTQPTLSGQVKALEERFGVMLFERRNRRIELTELGRGLYAITERRFALDTEAERLLVSAQAMLTGSLRIGADAPFHVFPLIASFSGRCPGVRLAFDFGNTAHVLAGLLARDTDVAILPEVPDDGHIEARFLRRDRLIVFTHRGHAWSRRRSIRFAELATQRVLLREPGSTTRAILERGLGEAGVVLVDSLEVGSREAVREGVAANLGVGVVAESEFGADDRLHRLTVRDVDLAGSEFVACLQEKRQDRVVEAFFDLLPEGGDGDGDGDT